MNAIARMKNVMGSLLPRNTLGTVEDFDAIKAITEEGDFNQDFEDFITGFGKMDKRIADMNELKKRVRKLKIDPNFKMDYIGDPKNCEYYTTKHYYYGLYVKEVWLKAMRNRDKPLLQSFNSSYDLI